VGQALADIERDLDAGGRAGPGGPPGLLGRADRVQDDAPWSSLSARTVPVWSGSV
jgi:hypothetical protein